MGAIAAQLQRYVYAHQPFRAATSNDRGPPYAMFQRRVDQCPVWADIRG